MAEPQLRANHDSAPLWGLTSRLFLENASLRQTFQVDREPRPTVLLPNLSSREWAVYRKIVSHWT
jgi:hypothetical protein